MISQAALRPRPLRILVTGASGLVGREVCGVLSARGHAVVALLHRSRVLARNDGAAMPTRSYHGVRRPGVVSLLDGDVTAERFGLGPAVADALAASLDLIVHCAALTAFNLPQASYDRVNVCGTARVLGFAAAARVPVLHVSTAYVCGPAEGVVAEAPSTAPRFNNGYEASKAAAEALVLAAHRRGQLVAIARPAIVAGAWQTGAIGAFGSLYHLVRLVAEGRTGALPAAHAASLNLVPVDHVAAALTDIAENMAGADGRIFHLASSAAVPLTALGALAAFPHLQAPHLLPPERFDRTRLSARQQGVYDRVTAPLACYLRPSPRFVTAHLAELSGRRCPATDGAYVHRLIRYAVEAGFLPGAAAAQRMSG